MFTNRISKTAVVVLILAIASISASFVTWPARSPAENPLFNRIEPPYIALERQAIREYELGERYGQVPENISRFSAEQIQREYLLGERYGVTPAQSAHDQALREYWLGERYGQTQ